MTEIQKLKSEIQSLKDLNKNLGKKLSIAKSWMQREIKESVKRINKKNINNNIGSLKNDFANENLENLITSKIRDFFGDYILMNISGSVIDNIISAELAYFNLKQNPNYDGFGVISSYHKALDGIIEQVITKGYRKFAKRNGQIHIRKNDTLEKALHSVVNKGYILSVGRFFHIIKKIKKDDILYDYVESFSKYIRKYSYLENSFISDEDFFIIFNKLINTEILGKKRHSGQITFLETKKAREYLIGNLENKKSLIYLLLENQDMDY